MSFLISGVLRYEVEVFATDDEGSMHFGGDHGSRENTTPNRNLAGEGAFFVCHPVLEVYQDDKKPLSE